MSDKSTTNALGYHLTGIWVTAQHQVSSTDRFDWAISIRSRNWRACDEARPLSQANSAWADLPRRGAGLNAGYSPQGSAKDGSGGSAYDFLLSY
jgi:hypothetical protein